MELPAGPYDVRIAGINLGFFVLGSDKNILKADIAGDVDTLLKTKSIIGAVE